MSQTSTNDEGLMTLVLVEDDPLLRDNLRILLSGEPGIKLVGAFASAEEALAQLDTLRPRLMLSDLNLPGMSGIDLIREAKQRFPDMEIMAHTIKEDRTTVFAALKAGATGYIIKGARPSALIEALYNLSEGGAPMSPKIARAVVQEFQDASETPESILSAKEKEVLAGIQEGLSYKEIGQKLFISPHTVHSHIKKIYEKLQARDKQDAISKARRRGLL